MTEEVRGEAGLVLGGLGGTAAGGGDERNPPPAKPGAGGRPYPPGAGGGRIPRARGGAPRGGRAGVPAERRAPASATWPVAR